MSHLAFRWAREVPIKDSEGKCVLRELADRANEQAGCWGNLQGIADSLGKSRRAVIAHIRSLSELGYIEVYERRDVAGRKLNDGYVLVGYHNPTEPTCNVLDCESVKRKIFKNDGGFEFAQVQIRHAQVQPVHSSGAMSVGSGATSATKFRCNERKVQVQPVHSSGHYVAPETLISTNHHITTIKPREDIQTKSVSGLAQTEVEERSQSSLAPLENFEKSQDAFWERLEQSETEPEQSPAKPSAQPAASPEKISSPPSEGIKNADTTAISAPSSDEKPEVPRGASAKSAKKTKTKKTKFDPMGAEVLAQLPEDLPTDVWEAWCDHRKAIRKPLTARAVSLQLRDLRECSAQPTAVLELSISNGWTGIFPNKADFPQRQKAAQAKQDDYSQWAKMSREDYIKILEQAPLEGQARSVWN